MNQKKKKKQNKVERQTIDLLPIVDYTYIDKFNTEAFVTKDGGYLDFVRILTNDLNARKDYDTLFDIYQFAKSYKAYANDLKLVIMNYPVDTYPQIQYVSSLLERTQNPVYTSELEKENYALQTAHEKYEELEFYFMFFSKDLDEYQRNFNILKTYLGKHHIVTSLPFMKKVQIVRKMNNMNTNLSTVILHDIPSGLTKGKTYNQDLLCAIQPQGNMTFSDERITKKGDGYEACIHVYDYKDTVSFSWLSDLCIFDDTICTVDISTADKAASIHSINKSMEEQASRYAQARQATERIDAQQIYNQLDDVYTEMVSMGEVLKDITIRIYVYNRTRDGLDKRIGEILTEIESKGFKSTVFLEENEYEWRSLFLSATEQYKLPNKRKGRSMPSYTYAIGHPYHFSSLHDPYGLYHGYTKTGGVVIYDKFQKDSLRLSYCGVIVGNMGTGKSTTMKKLIKSDAICGNYIRGFATNNEFNALLNHLGGSIIKLDGSDGFLNALQVYRTHENEADCFIKHIAKIKTFYSFLCPEADTYDLSELGNLLKTLYKKHMGYDEDSGTQITGLPPEQYPIWSDFLQVIREDLYEDFETKTKRTGISLDHFRRVEKIELIIGNLIDNYGKIFNGHSSMMDFEDEQIVFFSVENLKSFGSNIFDAQMFSALSLLWDNLLHIGQPMKELYDAHEIDLPDVTKYMIYMDEAHNFVNASKITAVEFLANYVRESRKFFGGIFFASQSITDFMPENSSQDGLAAIRLLFSLSQYKLIFKQGADSFDTLKSAFRDELPDNDLEEIAKFQQGECVLLTGAESIRFTVDISPTELELFTGGA